MVLRLSHHAAVHNEAMAGNKARITAHEKVDSSRDVGGLAQAPEGGLL